MPTPKQESQRANLDGFFWRRCEGEKEIVWTCRIFIVEC